MPWTREDEEEYQALLREQAREEARQRGQQALDQANVEVGPQSTAELQDDGPSFFRMIGGAAQDAFNNAIDLLHWVGETKDAAFGAVTGGLLDNTAARKKLGVPVTSFHINIVDDSPEDSWEGIGRSITSFMVPYLGASRALGAFKTGIGFSQTAMRSLAAGTAVNLTVMDATETNLANMLRDDFGFDNAMLDALATEEDDDLMVGRVKAAISNLPLDLAGEALVEGGVRLARAYRSTRQNNESTKAIIESTKDTITVNRKAAEKAAADAEAAKAAQQSGTDATPELNLNREAPVAKASGKSVVVGANETVVRKSQVKPEKITSIEQFTEVLQKQIGEVIDPAEIQRVADAFISNPEEALTLLKIDPAKLDYSVFSDPKAIKTLQNNLGDIVENVAKKTGRTGEVVSIKSTMKAARVLAVQPWALNTLKESVQNLNARLTAGRMIVGSHSHRLLDDAGKALAEVKAGGPGKAYAEFLQTLTHHAHLLGVLRGAGSEIGRALNTLKHEVTVAGQYRGLSETAAEAAQRARTAQAARRGGQARGKAVETKVDLGSDSVVRFLDDVSNGRINMDALDQIAKAAGVNPARAAKEMGLSLKELEKAKKAQTIYEDMFNGIDTDAGRMRLLNELINAKGDVARLTRIAQRKQATGLVASVDNAIRDTTGALFSMGTSVRNILSGTSMMFLRGLSHALAGVGLAGGAAISRNAEMSLAARKQMLKSWATFHAPISSFREGFSAAWKEIKGAGLEDFAIVADGLKLNDAAKAAQEAANEAISGTNRSFLRQDYIVSRGIMVSPERINAMVADTAEWPIGRMGQAGLEWFLRTGGAAVNAAGAGFRMGTTMFVNAPDQLTGTMATRIGQHTAAVDIAAREAAEAGLDGKALVAYIKGRTMELSELADAGLIGKDAFNDGARDLMEKAGIDYARQINFTDEFEHKWIETLGSSVGNVPIVGTLVLPFPRTPLRIMEKSVLDYTPLYAIKKSTREAWASGDAEVRGEIMARTAVATGLIAWAWEQVTSGNIVGFDGGFRNSSRLERDSYTLKIGADTWEFNMLDPLGTVIGLVADIREYAEYGKDNREIIQLVDGEVALAGQLATDMMEAVFWGAFKNVFSKAWLQSLEQVTQIGASRSMDEFSSLGSAAAAGLATRAVPLSGVQRQIAMVEDPTMRQARGIIEGMAKASLGSSVLPERRDPIFGRPMEFSAGQRLVGYKGGPKILEPVNKEVARLGFEMTMPRWKQRDVELTSAQMSRFLELRGHTIKLDGMTLEENLTDLINSPFYEAMTDEARVEEIKSVISPYTRAATDQLIREDDSFAEKILLSDLIDEFRLEGRDMRELKPELDRLSKELGIRK